ncbi:hypothetical protein ACFX2I_042659 [Malus domestica]
MSRCSRACPHPYPPHLRSETDACNLFNQMPHKDLVTWTALISGYSQHDRPQDALVLFPEMLRHGLEPNQFTLSSLLKALFPEMLRHGLEPNQFTLSSLLKASGAVSDDNHGRQLHTYCFKYGLDSNVYVGTALVDMYARCGHMDESQLVFDASDTKNEVSWNALIAGHARKAQGEHALRLFWKKQRAVPYRIFNLGNTSSVAVPTLVNILEQHMLVYEYICLTVTLDTVEGLVNLPRRPRVLVLDRLSAEPANPPVLVPLLHCRYVCRRTLLRQTAAVALHLRPGHEHALLT